LDLVPLLGKLGLVEPKLTFGKFFDFRFGVNAGGFFKLTPTLSKRTAIRAILVFRRATSCSH
jgi:hypothetical protein